jgi:hypothetical protein
MSSKTTSGNPVAVEDTGELDEIDLQNLVQNAVGDSFKPKSQEAPKADKEAEDETEEVEEVEETETTDEEEAETDEEAEGEKGDDVLSQIDFDKLSADDAEQLGQELYRLLGADKASAFGKAFSSTAGRDIGDLRRDRAKWKETAEKLQKQLDEGLSKFTSDNPFSSIQDEEQLDKVESDMTKALEYYQTKALEGDWEENDKGEEGLYDGRGDFYTRKQISAALRNMQSNIRHVATQRQKLRDLGDITKSESAEFEKVKELLTWLSDKESDKYKRFKSLSEDSELQLVSRIAPKLGAKLNKILAYYVEGESKPTATKKKLVLPRKATAVSGSMGGARPAGGSGNKSRQKLQEKLNSGDYTEDDLTALLFNQP